MRKLFGSPIGGGVWNSDASRPGFFLVNVDLSIDQRALTPEDRSAPFAPDRQRAFEVIPP
jgi:hypothetical protein